jgi:hypothetical protein
VDAIDVGATENGGTELAGEAVGTDDEDSEHDRRV